MEEEELRKIIREEANPQMGAVGWFCIYYMFNRLYFNFWINVKILVRYLVNSNTFMYKYRCVK